MRGSADDQTNAFEADFSAAYDAGDPEGYRCAGVPFGEAAGYRCAGVPFGKAAGGRELAVSLFELPPGETLCPYHYEYVEDGCW